MGLFVADRLNKTRLEPLIRALTPLAVSAAFAVGLVLAARPALPTSGLNLRDAAHQTVQLVRDARDAARALRSAVSG